MKASGTLMGWKSFDSCVAAVGHTHAPELTVSHVGIRLVEPGAYHMADVAAASTHAAVMGAAICAAVSASHTRACVPTHGGLSTVEPPATPGARTPGWPEVGLEAGFDATAT